MQVLISASSIGGNAGPFNIYQNFDSYATPVATSVSRASILSGYTVTVNDATTIVRLISSGLCTNSTDITVTGQYTYSANGFTLESSTTPFCEAVMKNRQLTIRRYTIYIQDSFCNSTTSHPGFSFLVSRTSVNFGTDYEYIVINSGQSSAYTTYIQTDSCDFNNEETMAIETVPFGLTDCFA